jgi:hypothetical protein
MFGLGSEYQDTCSNNNCMGLLSIQVMVSLVTEQLSNYASGVGWPYVLFCCLKLLRHITSFPIYFMQRLILLLINKIKISRANKKISKNVNAVTEIESVSKSNEKKVSLNIATEKNKSNSDTALDDQYTNKVLLYGYISVKKNYLQNLFYIILHLFYTIKFFQQLKIFAAAFSLGPLILFLINVIDIRLDAARLLWFYRRPVGYKAEDIGTKNYHILFSNKKLDFKDFIFI